MYHIKYITFEEFLFLKNSIFVLFFYSTKEWTQKTLTP